MDALFWSHTRMGRGKAESPGKRPARTCKDAQPAPISCYGGQAFCLIPDASGQPVAIGAGETELAFGEAMEPFGRDVIVAVLTSRKLNPGEREEYTWDQVFAALGLPALQQAIAAVTRDPAMTRSVRRSQTWQAASLVLETRP